jgi:hypothetical protein
VPGTTVVGFGSGSGGVGNYVVNFSQTVSGEQMFGVTPSSSRIGVNINQQPVVSAATIVVSLA